MTRKADDVWGAFLARYRIKWEKGGVKITGEGSLDLGDLLVKGIAGGICQVPDVLLAALGIEGWGKEGVEAKEFVAVVGQGFEGYTFGMTEVEEIEGFGKWGEGNLQVVEVGKEYAEVGGDEQATGLLELQKCLTDGTEADAPLSELGYTVVDFPDKG